tara:strand:+ start:26664 stop:27041 length:378 start_codon:yes stop_codon:yes gene_type:complete
MGITAKGVHAFAICDRCGFKLPYLSLRMEWTGHRVCQTCWEPKHQQLTPKIVQDAIGIRYPRPGENKREDIRVVHKVGFEFYMQVGLAAIGTQVVGLAGTTALGDEEAQVLGWGEESWGDGGWGE